MAKRAFRQYSSNPIISVPNVTFTCNALLEKGATVKVCYGTVDICIGLAKAQLKDFVDACFSRNSYLEIFSGSNRNDREKKISAISYGVHIQ